MAFTGIGYQLQPSSQQVPTATNYISDFNFLNQYLPDTYEKEFERFGNRTVSSFLRMVGAEMPSNSDLIKWAEQGRLHIKYTQVGTAAAINADKAVFQVNDPAVPAGFTTTGKTPFAANNQIALRKGQTVVITKNTSPYFENKGIVIAGPGDNDSSNVQLGDNQFEIAFYEEDGYKGASGGALTDTGLSVFIYGSEFSKGTLGMDGSLEADSYIFENSPIILKDKYAVNGSDMAQIGWIEVTTENGATGYLWYMKSEHETRLRFDDYLETAMVEAVPAEPNSGAIAEEYKGSEGVFHAIQTRGNLWTGGNPTTLDNFDTIVARLDKQGSIEENVLFLDRDFSFDIDDMLATLNGLTNTTGGAANAASFGLFDNDTEMALNLGFSGFRRGYDFYKTDWKYLNDPTMRGGLIGGIDGMLVPAGSTTVYDQILGKNAKRPFLHVRYRASETEDRRYKTWITGSAGGAMTSDLDAMEVNYLSERCVCVLGANNFVLFES